MRRHQRAVTAFYCRDDFIRLPIYSILDEPPYRDIGILRWASHCCETRLASVRLDPGLIGQLRRMSEPQYHWQEDYNFILP